MQKIFPTRIRKVDDNELKILWNDGSEMSFRLKELRDECPCASCKGETILLKTYLPEKKADAPGKYELKNIEQVGTYAIKLSWGDGHDTGIYSFEYLKNFKGTSSDSADE